MSISGMRIEPINVVDTHALIWYLTNDRKLGAQAAEVFAAAERGETRLVVSAVAAAEMYYANKKYNWFADFGTVYHRLKAVAYFRFVPFEAEHVLYFDEDAAVPEMLDRIIDGLARRLKAPLLTSDPQIVASEAISIIW